MILLRIAPSLKSWVGTITRKMPHLSKPQAKVKAMWSFAIAITQSSVLTTVLVFLAKLLGIKENTMGQRLREWLRNAEDKKGNQTKAIEVTSCKAALRSWILSQWQPGENQLASSMDATIGQRSTVLAQACRGSRLCHRCRLENREGDSERSIETILVRAF